jgi:hypothetical protein
MLWRIRRYTGIRDQPADVRHRCLGHRSALRSRDSNAGGRQGSPLAIEHKIYFDFVGIAHPPYEYESRLRSMYEGAFQHLHRLVMEPIRRGPYKVETG